MLQTYLTNQILIYIIRYENKKKPNKLLIVMNQYPGWPHYKIFSEVYFVNS